MGKIPNRFIHFITRLSKHPSRVKDTFLDVAKFAADASMLGYHTIWHIVGDANRLKPSDYEKVKECIRPSHSLTVLFSYRYSTKQLYGSNMANFSLHYIRNVVDGYNPERTWVNLLDDDNTIHPELMKVFLELEERIEAGNDYMAWVCGQVFRYKEGGINRGIENPVDGDFYNVAVDFGSMLRENNELYASSINGVLDSSQIFFRADVLADAGGFNPGYFIDGWTLLNIIEHKGVGDLNMFFSTSTVGAWYNYYTEIEDIRNDETILG